MKRLDRTEIIFKIIAYTLVGVFALSTLYPFIFSVSAAISGQKEMMNGEIVLYPKSVQFDAIMEIINGKFAKRFWMGYINTIFYTFYGTIFSVFLSIFAAYALSKPDLLFKRKISFFIVFTMWFSAGTIPVWLNFQELGVNNRWGMIYGFGLQAFNILLLRNYFNGIPREIEEAAFVDGANEFQILSKIYIPMSKSAITTVTLFYALGRWNGYFWNRVLVGGEENTLQVVLREILELSEDTEGHSFLYDPKSLVYATIILSIIPIIVIYPYLQRYFAAGVNVGGVKE